MLRQLNYSAVILLCLFQIAVPAKGAVLCIGEAGHVAIELITGCALQTPNDFCASGQGSRSCPHCIGEDDHRDCRDISPSTVSLSSRSSIPITPAIHSGWAVSATALHAGAPSFGKVGTSGYISNPFLIQSMTQRSFFCVVLQI